MEHKALKDAYARLLDLPEADQADAAEWIETFLARREGQDLQLTPEQVAEVKRRMAEPETEWIDHEDVLRMMRDRYRL